MKNGLVRLSKVDCFKSDCFSGQYLQQLITTFDSTNSTASNTLLFVMSLSCAISPPIENTPHSLHAICCNIAACTRTAECVISYECGACVIAYINGRLSDGFRYMLSVNGSVEWAWEKILTKNKQKKTTFK